MTSRNVTTRRQLKPITAREVEARARAKDRKVRVYEVERAACYYVHSQSERGIVYHQTRESNGWHCECKGFAYTGMCKHLGQLERRSEREGWSFGRIARHCHYDDDVQAEIVNMLRAD